MGSYMYWQHSSSPKCLTSHLSLPWALHQKSRRPRPKIRNVSPKNCSRHVAAPFRSQQCFVGVWKKMGMVEPLSGRNLINIHAYWHTLHYITPPYLTLPNITLRYLILTLLYYLTLPCVTLPCITLPYITFPSLTLHYITLHDVTLHWLTLHCCTLNITLN